MVKTLKPQFIMILMLSLISVSCVKTVSRNQILMGNFAWNQGNYQKAIINYLNAESSDIPTNDVVNYNLGNVYYALGEVRAALVAWERAESQSDRTDTLFRIVFNKGLLYYHMGRYKDAYLSFKQALKLNPKDMDAKINLEESLSRIPSSDSIPSSLEVPTIPQKEYSRILEYIEQQEASQWQPQITDTEESLNDW